MYCTVEKLLMQKLEVNEVFEASISQLAKKTVLQHRSKYLLTFAIGQVKLSS